MNSQINSYRQHCSLLKCAGMRALLSTSDSCREDGCKAQLETKAENSAVEAFPLGAVTQ